MASSVDQSGQLSGVRVGILTISDRSSRGLRDDLSGPAIKQVADEMGFTVSISQCIPDDISQIAQTLTNWADNHFCDCILTTGGTGLSSRDVTPEATATVLDRQLMHLASQIALSGASSVPTAVLSRALAGTRGQVLIVNLPGSPNGARDGARIALAVAEHAVDVLRDDGDKAH
jgi:molybdopterin adenylyltransferase